MPPLSSLLKLLQSDLESSQQMADLLTQEKQALQHEDLATLQQILQHKAESLSVIEANRIRRDELLFSMGISANNEDLTIFLQEQSEPQAEDCLEALERLQEIVKLCSEFNELNGIVILNSKKRTQRRLELLKGIPAGQRLYNSRGDKTVTSQTGNGHPVHRA